MDFYMEGWIHPKNKIGIDLMIEQGMNVEFVYDKNKEYDWIISLSEFNVFENHKGGLIYGPHMMFPAINSNIIPNKKGRTYCNALSNWNKILCEDIMRDVKFLSLPFAVDVNRFKPSEKNGLPIIYFKTINPEILKDVINHLGTNFLFFNYDAKYDEETFRIAIAKAPFAIWIGRHESQGFAFQETLSSNTPIFVIDIRSLREEIGSSWVNFMPGHDLKATAASYFDSSCGVISYPERWKEDWENFNYKNFSPRDFIVYNISAKPCLDIWEKTLINL